MSEERDCKSEDRDDDTFDSANDPRRSTNIQGPEIAGIDSLEIHSDGSFFDFEELDRAEVYEEMIGNITEHTCNTIEAPPYVG